MKEEPEEGSKDLVKKVASGKRIVKKQSIFFDTLKNVGTYILYDILIPAAKATVSDMMKNGTDMILWGEPRGNRRDRDRGTHVSYTSYYDRDRDRDHDRGRDRERPRSRFRLDEIILESRSDANDVLQQMFNILDEYNSVTVAEFLELVDVPDEFTDQNYGWTNLRDAEVKRIREGYIIDLPAPKALPR
jgi:hypothetical protein